MYSGVFLFGHNKSVAAWLRGCVAAWLRGCVAANFARYAGACQVLRAIFVRFFAGKCTVFIGASLRHYYYSITRFSADFNVSRFEFRVLSGILRE